MSKKNIETEVMRRNLGWFRIMNLNILMSDIERKITKSFAIHKTMNSLIRFALFSIVITGIISNMFPNMITLTLFGATLGLALIISLVYYFTVNDNKILVKAEILMEEYNKIFEEKQAVVKKYKLNKSLDLKEMLNLGGSKNE